MPSFFFGFSGEEVEVPQAMMSELEAVAEVAHLKLMLLSALYEGCITQINEAHGGCDLVASWLRICDFRGDSEDDIDKKSIHSKIDSKIRT